MSKAGGHSAHPSSVSHWWHQRVTAVALIPLGLWLALTLPVLDLGSQAALVAWLREPMTAILLGLLVICGGYHSWLGVQVVLEDYVPDAGQLRISLRLSIILHYAVIAAGLYAIVHVFFGDA